MKTMLSAFSLKKEITSIFLFSYSCFSWTLWLVSGAYADNVNIMQCSFRVTCNTELALDVYANNFYWSMHQKQFSVFGCSNST